MNRVRIEQEIPTVILPLTALTNPKNCIQQIRPNITLLKSYIISPANSLGDVFGTWKVSVPFIMSIAISSLNVLPPSDNSADRALRTNRISIHGRKIYIYFRHSCNYMDSVSLLLVKNQN